MNPDRSPPSQGPVANTGPAWGWADPDAGLDLEEQALCTGPVGPARVLALTRASLLDMDATSRCVSAWLQEGLSMEDLYLHGMVPAARLQGLWWVRDQLDFSALTVGCSRLHRLLYELSPLFMAEAEPAQEATVLILPEPDSQHTMGVFMLSEFFRRAGWHTLLLQPHELDDTLRIVTTHWVDVLALSVSSDRHFAHLERVITEARRLSPNPHIQIIAGGAMAAWMPEALLALGVDWLGADAKSTIERANDQRTRRRAFS